MEGLRTLWEDSAANSFSLKMINFASIPVKRRDKYPNFRHNEWIK